MEAILNSSILKLVTLDSANIVFLLKLTHTCQDWFPQFVQKTTSLIHSHLTWWWQPSWILPSWNKPFCTKNFSHSFSFNLMMAANLNSEMLDSATAMLDSDTLLSSLRFTQKHSHSTLTLTQTNSIWLTWWWQPSWILPSSFCHLGFSHLSISSQTHSHLPRLVSTICTQKTSFIHCDSTWKWQPSWILPSWIWPSWIQPS